MNSEVTNRQSPIDETVMYSWEHITLSSLKASVVTILDAYFYGFMCEFVLDPPTGIERIDRYTD